MSKAQTPANDKKAKTAANLDTVLTLATDTARAELGEAGNKSVTAAATLTVSATENDTTDETGVNASVSLGVTSSTKTVAGK